jgi:hypothetical protein
LTGPDLTTVSQNKITEKKKFGVWKDFVRGLGGGGIVHFCFEISIKPINNSEIIVII